MLGTAAFWLPSGETRIAVGSWAWRRCVLGARHGSLARGAVIVLPGLDRRTPRLLTVEAASDGGSALSVRVDQQEPVTVVLEGGATGRVLLPAAGYPGLRLVLRPPAPGPAVELRALVIDAAPRPRWWGLAPAGAVAAALVASGFGPLGAAGFGVFSAGLLGLPRASFLDWLTLPSSWRVFAGPLLLLVVGAASFGLAARARGRAPEAAGWVGLCLALFMGAWLRIFFLPAPGSWDTEYWKAWMHRTVGSGLGLVYGPAESVPDGHFLAQLTGAEPRWEVEERGRSYPVDYPPLAMAVWAASSNVVTALAPRMDANEADYVAVKLAAVIGDVLGTLLIAFGAGLPRPRADTLAAAYWVLPSSWLSSAVLGFLDGALAPAIAVALLASGSGRPLVAGVCLALAALIKPTALIVAPAIVVALLAGRGAGARAAPVLAKATLSGLAALALVMIPFLAQGTLATAVVHCYRILSQAHLSGGYPNIWWLIGHAANVATGATASLLEAVDHAGVDILQWPARPLGTLLFASAAAFLVRAQAKGPRAAALAGAGLLAAYGLLAVGVHENHVMPLFLLLLLSGLPTRRLRWIFVLNGIVYTLGMLCQSGLGRMYGRFAHYKAFLNPVEALRLAPGFDLTLALSVLNLVAFAWLLWGARSDQAAVAGPILPQLTARPATAPIKPL